MRLYVLDVGVYARAPLLSNLAQLVQGGHCIITRAILQVFRHRLRNSIKYFIENYNAIKQSLQGLLPRHSRKRSVRQALMLIESMRHGNDDALFYTVLLAILSTPPARRSTGRLLEALLVSLENTRHVIGLLDTLYLWLHASSRKGLINSLVSSIEHTLNHYLENTLDCEIGADKDYTELVRDATRLADELKAKDKEDIAILLSLCSLYKDLPSSIDTITLVTTDHKIKDIIDGLRSHNKCFTKITVQLANAR